ncbi:hypothetical protein OIU77_005099 [Salix suchowensis]|uniref:Uncharacterized protein n=1 Tax=Salix suchowensis TaxID=1278906 RepID=A0ABQ9AP81_9ROSI|nr:hypothetical protein OIU77_005099 [Salix suchowensis]
MGEVGLLLEYSIIPPTKYESNEESKHGRKLSQSKDIKHDHLQVGVHHLVHQCNKLVMATCRLEHILVHQHHIICLNQLIQAILHNNHLVDTPPTGTSHLSQQISKIKVMITIASHPHPSSKLLVVLQLQQIALVIITARHQLLAITNKGRAIAKMAMVGINSLGMVSHHLMINSKVILLASSLARNPASYPPQGAAQPGYGLPPSSQSGYGSQPAAQYGSYGASQPQKPSANPPVYGQSQQSPSTTGGYGQPTGQPGYPHSQPVPSGYVQPDSGSQSAPPSSYGATGAQPGYAPPYGAPPAGQPGYGQGPPPYSSASYGSGYSQPAAYSADGNATSNARGTYESAPASQTAQQSGVAKASPQS